MKHTVYTVSDMFEDLKNEGEKQRKAIEEAEDLTRIVNELANTRIQLGLTQKELAVKVGLTQSAIARFENLDTIPRLDTVTKIARGLGKKINIVTSVRVSVSSQKSSNISFKASRVICAV